MVIVWYPAEPKRVPPVHASWIPDRWASSEALTLPGLPEQRCHFGRMISVSCSMRSKDWTEIREASSSTDWISVELVPSVIRSAGGYDFGGTERQTHKSRAQLDGSPFGLLSKDFLLKPFMVIKHDISAKYGVVPPDEAGNASSGRGRTILHLS
jgi:hypothetical protein